MSGAEDAEGKIEEFLTEIEWPRFSSTHKRGGFWGAVDEIASTLTGEAKWLDNLNKAKKRKY